MPTATTRVLFWTAGFLLVATAGPKKSELDASRVSKLVGGELMAQSVLHRVAQEASQQHQGVVLEGELAEVRYLLAEPIFVRCSVRNTSANSVTVPYSYFDPSEQCTFVVRMVAPDGSLVPLNRAVVSDTIGPGPIPIAPQRHHTETIDLYDIYALSKPGRYQVSLHFKSDGTYYTMPPGAPRPIAHEGWSGSLSVPLGHVDIVPPEEPVDIRALREITPEEELVPRTGDIEYPYIYAVTGEPGRRMLIDQFPESRYTAYARYYQALNDLYGYGVQLRTNINSKLATSAIHHLEAIDRSDFPPLFQELVLSELVKAHKAAAVSLDEAFRREFPESPVLVDKDQ